MATLCNLSVPAQEFGLAATLQAVPVARITSQPVAASSQTECFPLLRAHAPDRQPLETALTSDATVATWTRLTDGTSDWLYRIEWAMDVSLVHHLLTAEQVLVLSATASDEEWTLRVLYPSRAACSQIHTFCTEHNVDVTIDSIRESDGDQFTRHGLTEAQHTAIVEAYEQGYFNVPRDVDLEAVSDELGITHQALSERLRRAHRTVIEGTVLRGPEMCDSDE